MTIEITSCQDCPFKEIDGGGVESYFQRCYLQKEIVDFELPSDNLHPSCPLRQDNTVVFKLKEDAE